jgi:SprB repeat
VTDNNGCTALDSATITQPGAKVLGVSIARAKNVSCSGSFDGMALALGSGGVMPYTYSWSPGGNTSSLVTGLSAATYTVLITDATGCNAIAVANITQPSVLRVTDTTIAALALIVPPKIRTGS